MTAARSLLVLAAALSLAACAAGKSAPANAPSAESAGAAPAQQYPATTPAPDAPPSAPAGPNATSAPGGEAQPGTLTQRQLAMQSAKNEIEAGQRELDVAAGDCRNACRALGSMDRAAGRLCGLTQPGETGRCDDAKKSLYTARDRVKQTCGQCEGGPSVDRSAPVPSQR